jgi:hypothetical protein
LDDVRDEMEAAVDGFVVKDPGWGEERSKQVGRKRNKKGT